MLGGGFLDQSFLATWRSGEGVDDVAAAAGSQAEGLVGVSLVMWEGFVTVLRVMSPAKDAGVKIMDRLVAVNGNVASDVERVSALLKVTRVCKSVPTTRENGY